MLLTVNIMYKDDEPSISRRIVHIFFIVTAIVCPLLILSATTGHAADFHKALSLQGFTGIMNTPNAEVTSEGKIYLLYSDQRESQWRAGTRNQDNYLFSAGLFSFAEVGARLTDSADVMDLSGNFKIKVPFIPQGYYLPDIAFGMQDVSGGSSHLRTSYAVATQELWRLRLSLGYGAGPDRMNGLFGGAEIKALDWLYLLGEYDTRETSVGVRLVTPSVMGYPVNLQVTAKSSLDYKPENLEFAFGLQFPLGRDYRNGTTSREKAGATETPPTQVYPERAAPAKALPTSPPGPGKPGEQTPAALGLLRGKLVEGGFQNVRVGAKEGALLVVEYENSRFNHNELDALGVVAGTVVDTMPDGFEATVRLVMKKKGIRVIQFTAPYGEFRDFLRHGGMVERFSQALRISTDVQDEPGVAFSDGYSSPTWLRSALLLSPGLKTFVGTELGAFDYLLSLKLDYYLNAWKGAVVNARWDIPLTWSENFDDGGGFRNNREDSRLERLMLFQAIKPAPSVMLNLGGGMLLHDVYGTLNELVWTPGNGSHRLRLSQAYLDGTDNGYKKNQVYLGSYRYYVEPLALHAEGTVGQFMHNDKGLLLELRRYFGDTSFSLYYKNTKADGGESVQVAGVKLALPLTPRRDLKPGLLQVRGSEEWSYFQETRIVGSGGMNIVDSPSGINPQVLYNVDTAFHNRDRLNEPYIRGNLVRLRNAYETYRVFR